MRGLPNTGDAKELKHSVMTYMNEVGRPPSILPPKGGKVQNATNVVTSMVCMISHIMTEYTTPKVILEVDHAIKIYLSMVHRFEISMNKEPTKKYTWVSKSNYMSLLNIPRQMELYGPMRMYWEGGYRGEGIIQEIKGIINNGLIIGWQNHTMKRFYNNRALKFLANESSSNISTRNEDSVVDQPYRRY